MKKNNLTFWMSVLLAMGVMNSVAPDAMGQFTRPTRDSKDFAYFMMRLARYDAKDAIKQKDIKRALQIPLDSAKLYLHQLNQDSTYYANELIRQAEIIYDLDPNDFIGSLGTITDAKKYCPHLHTPQMDTINLNRKMYAKTLKNMALIKYSIKQNSK